MNSDDFLANTLSLIGSSCDAAGIEQRYRTVLSHEKRMLVVNYPIYMDNRVITIIKAIRGQHVDALGPYKGGIRLASSVTESEVVALSCSCP